jgi:2-polyprenyl-3-methyl-5-hydroxy-6-metoxy-1,4-benzoquinol methylase
MTSATACHICGSGRIVPYMTVSDNGHLRRADVKLSVYRCRDCDIVFLNPPPSPEIGREYFAGAYARNASGNIYYNDDFKERTSLLRLELLSGYPLQGRTLLDVGCGKGQFVSVARQNGWDAWGVEFDGGACDYARQRFGLETVFKGSLDHPALPGAFDVVTLWDVIEHVPDPVGVLRQAASRLRQGGMIVIRTANIRSWAFDRHRARWWAFGCDHRFYFSPHALRLAMGAAGFTVKAVLNREPVERPGKRRSLDISETPPAEALRSLSRSPAKLRKLGDYSRSLARRLVGHWRYGAHYETSIMTVLGTNGLDPRRPCDEMLGQRSKL